jgi:hypothetical protein
MDVHVGHPEYLRSLDALDRADPRSDNQALVDVFKPGASALHEHHSAVEKLGLNKAVPESVVVQFETAKNLYLYSWFVYRFFPVAEHHALTCLELGLRSRFAGQVPKKFWNKPRDPTLRPLLAFAIASGAIKNESLRGWQNEVYSRARDRYSRERLAEMIESGAEQTEMDYASVQPNDRDRNWNYVETLRAVLPEIRNSYAHGSTRLGRQVLGTLELVSELLNQLYPETDMP